MSRHRYSVSRSLTKLFGAMAVVAGAVALLPAWSSSGSPTPASAVSGADKDCADFPNQAAAQHFYLTHNPAQDPDRLDADHDGIACEELPCPCNHGDRGGGGGGHHHQHHHPHRHRNRSRRVRVSSITDGDTIRVTGVNRTNGSRPVRIIGIDTPEIYGHRECGGPQASRAMHRLLHPGQHVTIIKDPSQDAVDRYGRLLRYVVHDGADVGRLQIAHGWAHVYVYAHNPFNRVKPYRHAQRRAQRNRRGVWSLCGHFKRSA